MRTVIFLSACAWFATGPVRAEPEAADLKTNMAAYVRVAAGWVANQQCHFLAPDQDAKFNASVEQNTLRLGAALDATAGKEKANAALAYMQQQGAAYASANFSDCGKGASEAVSKAQSDAASINTSLANYAPTVSGQ
jgi:hypothetical protein